MKMANGLATMGTGYGPRMNGTDGRAAGQIIPRGPVPLPNDGNEYLGAYNIVYRDSRGSTRSTDWAVLYSRPSTVSFGRKIPGMRIGYWLPETGERVLLSQIIAATPKRPVTPVFVNGAAGQPAGQVTTGSPFAWANMVSLASARDVWASPYSDRILVTRGDGGPAMLVHPTHNVVFTDYNGVQQSGPAFCEVKTPYWEGGVLVRGDVACYVPGVPGRLRADQIVSANPYAMTSQAWFVRSPFARVVAGQAIGPSINDTDFAAQEAAKLALQNGAAESGKPNPVAGLSDAALGSLFGAIGQSIGLTVGAVAAAIASGNQVEIARINQATQMYIADMQRQGRAVDAQNAIALSTSLNNNAAYIPPAPPATTWTDNEKYAAAGAGVLVLGLAAWLLLRKKAKKNPVIQRGDQRFFVQAPDAPGFLAKGFSVVGKTSSTRRRRRAAK